MNQARSREPANMSDDTQPPLQQLALPIEWHVPESVQRRYATHALVQAGLSEIILTFFEAQMPILTGEPEQNKAKLEAMGAVRAEGVARIIMAPDQAAALIQILKTTVDTYLAVKAHTQAHAE